MNPDELIESLAVKIWSEPFSTVLDDGSLAGARDPFSILVLLLCLNTEYQMNGILNFIGNSTGRYLDETVDALCAIGADGCHRTLDQIRSIATNAGMTHNAIQLDMMDRREYEVVTWQQIHGDKWTEAEDKINALGDRLDLEEMWSCAAAYVGNHIDQIFARYEELANKTSAHTG